jgi:hypothetical protein
MEKDERLMNHNIINRNYLPIMVYLDINPPMHHQCYTYVYMLYVIHNTLLSMYVLCTYVIV